MLIILSLLVMAKAKAGTSIVIIASMIFLLSLLNNQFMFVFWIIPSNKRFYLNTRNL